MLQSIGDFLGDRGSEERVVGEDEVRHWIEGWLRNLLAHDAVYCERVRGGSVVVRVGRGMLLQEVRLWEWDLCDHVRRELHYEVSRVQFVE